MKLLSFILPSVFFIINPLESVYASGKTPPKKDIDALMGEKQHRLSHKRNNTSIEAEEKKTKKRAQLEDARSFKYGNNQDKKTSKIVQHTTLKEQDTVREAEVFFTSDDEENKKLARKILYQVVNGREQYCSFKEKDQKKFEKKLISQLNAAEILMKRGNNGDQKVTQEILKTIYSKALNLTVEKNSESSVHNMGQRSLELLTFHNENLMSFEALKALWAYGDKNYREIARKKLRNIAKQNDSPHQFEAAQYLCAEQDSIGFEAMQTIAQQVNHTRQYKAAEILYCQGDDFFEKGKKVLEFIAKQEGHPDQKKALTLLKDGFIDIVSISRKY